MIKIIAHLTKCYSKIIKILYQFFLYLHQSVCYSKGGEKIMKRVNQPIPSSRSTLGFCTKLYGRSMTLIDGDLKVTLYINILVLSYQRESYYFELLNKICL